jgi:uncharacterized protein YbdZ (MbtH family)
MSEHDDDPFDTYNVVVNHEEQYSIWPTEKDLPNGWSAVGKTGPKGECLAYIEEVWTDMRPLSLRKQLEEWARTPPEPVSYDSEAESFPPLVDRLCEGEHSLIFNCRPERTAQALKERLEMGYIHLKFTETRGGTELGVRLDSHASDWSAADFGEAKGNIRIVGDLTLDYVKVRCIASLNVATLAGVGRLERVSEAAAD